MSVKFARLRFLLACFEQFLQAFQRLCDLRMQQSTTETRLDFLVPCSQQHYITWLHYLVRRTLNSQGRLLNKKDYVLSWRRHRTLILTLKNCIYSQEYSNIANGFQRVVLSALEGVEAHCRTSSFLDGTKFLVNPRISASARLHIDSENTFCNHNLLNHLRNHK